MFDGLVKVNEAVILFPDWQVFLEFERVELQGKVLKSPGIHRMLMMNKPPNVLTQSGLKTECPEPCVTDLLPAEFRKPPPAIYGRLDKDTSGLLLFGTDGALMHNLLHPTKHVDKTYWLKTAKPLAENAEESLRAGVTLVDGSKCLPGTLERLEDPLEYRLTIQEGMYHQVPYSFSFSFTFSLSLFILSSFPFKNKLINSEFSFF